ncbi:MAG: YraN family protein [Halarsenatibacteraceae bacterium]
MEEIGRKMLGNIGEDLAARYLEDKGYQVIERNYYCRQGEIDLIVSREIGQERKIDSRRDSGRRNETARESEIVFIEVKTISNLAFGAAEYRIDRRKQAKIRYTAREYLAGQDKYYDRVRFDGIFIFRKETGWKINHIENAF